MELQSEHINELATALCKAQAEIMPALKDSANPFFKSKYADLESVWNACRDPLTKNGLCVMQAINTIENQMVLVTTLAHSSGQFIRSLAPIIVTKMEPQAIGSAISYFRRYSLAALVGVVQSDDDGELAQQRSKVIPENQPPKQEYPKSSGASGASGGKITEKQLKWLSGLIKSNTAFLDKILKDYNIQSLADLPFSEFNFVLEQAKNAGKPQPDLQFDQQEPYYEDPYNV